VHSDLDDILSGLDDNIAKTPSSSSPTEPAKKSASSPIENLPKGCCAGCRKFIVGEVTTAMGRSYHPDHFVCASCSTVIGTCMSDFFHFPFLFRLFLAVDFSFLLFSHFFLFISFLLPL
jgi:hypothetical protein